MNSAILTWILLVVLAFTVVQGARLAATSRPVDWFEPIYCASAYFFLIFVARGVYALTVGTEFLGEPPIEPETLEAMNKALAYLLPAFVLFLAAYKSSAGRVLAHALPYMPSSWSPTVIRYGWPFFAGLGISFLTLQILAVGGLETYLTDKQTALSAPGQSYLAQGSALISYSFLMVFSWYCVSGNGRAIAFFALAPLVLLTGFASGAKGVFLLPVLGMIIVRHYLKHKVSARMLVAFAVAVVLIVPVFNAYRHLESQTISEAVASMFSADESVGVEGALSVLLWQFMARFHDFDSLTYIVRDTPSVMDFQYGETLTPLVYAWIPRLLWEDKPIISFGKVFSDTYYRDFFFGTGTAASPSILGEAYINFHLFGMLSAAIAAGICLRFAYELLIGRQRTATTVFVYACLFVPMFIFWESNIAGFVGDLLARVAIVVSLVGLAGKPIKHNRSALESSAT